MFFFLAYFTLYNRLSFIHLIRTESNVFFFNGRVIFHCVYVPQLSYPFICQWASRLLPCPGYYKQCCDEHWGARVSFRSGFLGVYVQKWCWIRFLRVPWTARRSNPSILKKIDPEYSLEGLMLSWSSDTLASWCEEPTHWKRPWCWERLKAGGKGDDRG